MYDEMLQGTGLVLPKKQAYNRHSYYLYVVRHPLRDTIISKLKEKQIFFEYKLSLAYSYNGSLFIFRI